MDVARIDVTEKIREKIKPVEDISYADAFEWITDFLQDLPEVEKFVFNEQAKDRLIELSIMLIQYGEGYSEKVANYTKLKEMTITEFLAKLLAVLLLQHSALLLFLTHL